MTAKHPGTARRLSILPPYCSAVPPRVPQNSHHIVTTTAMRTPVPLVHSPQRRHASPTTPTRTSSVPPHVPQFIHHIVLCTAMLPPLPQPHCLQHHHTPSSIPTLLLPSPWSSPYTPARQSQGQETPPCRTDPPLGPWAGPMPLRLYQVPFAGSFSSNPLERWRHRSSARRPSCRATP